jgi:hypothetical protein
MQLLVDESRKITIRSLYDERLSIFPDEIAAGDTLPLQVGVVDKIINQFSSRKFTPQDLTGVVLWAALGKGFLAPVAGKTTATFTAADSSTQTTPELPFDFTDADLEIALNSLSKILDIGGVTVEQPSANGQSGSDRDSFYVVTYNNVGARNLLSFDAVNLVPLSIVDVQRAATGDASTREVQTVRIVQNAGAINILDTAVASAGITLTNPRDGGAGVNEQYRVKLTGGIYSGSWTLSKTTGTTGTSAAIPFDDTEGQLRAKLEATTGIGSGNVNVTQEDEFTWLIEFIGALANTAITVTVNGGNLVAIPELSGTLDLRTPGIEMLLNGSEEKVVTLEIEKTVGILPPTKILRRDVLLVRPTIEPAMSTPQRSTFYNLFGSSPDINVSTAGTTDLAPGVPFAQWVQRIIAVAGTGAYTRKFTLDNLQPIIGAVYRIPVEIVASANPMLEFYDNVTTGTPLFTIAGDAIYQTEVFTFEADGHWHWVDK